MLSKNFFYNHNFILNQFSRYENDNQGIIYKEVIKAFNGSKIIETHIEQRYIRIAIGFMNRARLHLSTKSKLKIDLVKLR